MTDQEAQVTFLNINRLIQEEGNGQVWRVARQLDNVEYDTLMTNLKEIYFYLRYCEDEKERFRNVFSDLNKLKRLSKVSET